MSIDYKAKYLRYKMKYLNLKKNTIKQTGGGFFCNWFGWFCSDEEIVRKLKSEQIKGLVKNLKELQGNINMDETMCVQASDKCTIETYNNLINKLKNFCDTYIFTEVRETKLYEHIKAEQESAKKTAHNCDYSCKQRLNNKLKTLDELMKPYYKKYNFY